MTNPAYGMAAAQNEPLVSPFWEKDASYQYYKHGPLARVEIGNEKVQGVDYVYTAQGWMKGVNSNTLQADRDPGKDGVSAGTNELTAKDAFGFSLHYNDNDYKPIATGSTSFIADQTGSDVRNNGAQLYNGNIGRMVTTITKPDTREVLPLGNAYQYDQLNRLAHSKSFINVDLGANAWGSSGTYDNKYFNAFTYDANGNILTQIRHDSIGTKIDDLAYRYEKNYAGRLLRNRLYTVNDNVSSSLYSDDIDDMGTFDNNVNTINTANNYSYDGEGRLTKDKQEEIDTIIWRVDGKVKFIKRDANSQKNNLSFDYDAFGRRTAKHVYDANDNLLSSTYYILDAQGNVMTTYNLNIDTLNSYLTYFQADKYIYGSSRLGMLKDSVNVLGSAYTNTDTSNFIHTLGNKRYELTNHLGNVLSVISDKPIPHDNNGSVDYWMADIKNSQDYSPFGVILSGRSFDSDSSYLYGFQGQESDDQVSGKGNNYTAEFWQYDSRLGRRWNVDPVFKEYESPYVVYANNPIWFIDPNGSDTLIFNTKGELKETKESENVVFGVLGDDKKTEYSQSYDKNILEHQWNYSKDSKGKDLVKKIDVYQIKGNSNAVEIFEFLSNHTKVEWGLFTTKHGSSNSGFLFTDKREGKLNIEAIFYKKLLKENYVIYDSYHSHPGRTPYPSGYYGSDDSFHGPKEWGDMGALKQITKDYNEKYGDTVFDIRFKIFIPTDSKRNLKSRYIIYDKDDYYEE